MVQTSKENTIQNSFKIIVIDDDEGLNFLIRKTLKRAGFNVDGAENGESALSTIKGENNELLLVDYKLPDMNGKELVEKVKRKFHKIPNFISMTGFGDETIAVDMMKLGAKDYIIKETNFIDLLPEKITQICIRINIARKLEEADETIRKQSQLLRETGQMAKVGGWELNLHNNTLTFSESTKSIHEVPSDYTPALQEAIAFYPHETQPIVEQAVEKAINEGKGFDLELPFQTAKGRKLWVHAIGKPEMKDGKCVRLHGTFQDITERKKTEQNLINSELKFRNIAENVPGLVLRYKSFPDGSGKLLFISKSVEEIYEISRDEAINDVSLLWNRIHPDDLDDYTKSIEESAKTLSLWRREHRILLPNGRVKWLQGIAMPVEQEDGSFVFDTLGIDITDQKKVEHDLIKAKETAEKNEYDFKLLFDNMNQGFALHKMIYNKNDKPIGFKFVKLNPAYEKITQIDISKIIEKNIYEVYPDANTKWISIFNNIVENDKNEQFEFYYKKLNKYFLINAFHTGDKYFAILLTDITSLKKYEKDLIADKEKAEESDRLKSAFLANMSHEIRTPMNGILGFTSLLLEPNLTGEEQQKYIEVIQKSGNRMLNTVNDIINISKIESGLVELSVSEVNINEQLKYIYSFFKPEARKKGIQLIVDNDLSKQGITIKTDFDKFNSIVTNLVKNAIKYTVKGFVEFGYSMKKVDGLEKLEFYVKDSGIGIPKDRQTAIFERFIQADIEDKNAMQGSGLGLAISKAYAEMLGAKIWVESEVGKGSLFYFNIEYKYTSEDNEKDNAQVLIDNEISKKLKILIVEDDETSRNLINIYVKKFAQEIIEVGSGLEVVEFCRNNDDVDIILMDVQMPGISGYEATQKIREFNKDVVIIAQTAYALTGDREEAISMGCTDYISKPINKKELEALIIKYHRK